RPRPLGAECQPGPSPPGTCAMTGAGPAAAGPIFDPGGANCAATGALRASTPANANPRTRIQGPLRLAFPAYNGSAVRSRPARAEAILALSRGPVRPRSEPRRRLILAHPEGAAGRLDAVAGAPPRDEGARQRCVGNEDREGVVQHAARPRRHHGPPVGTAILV